jgi:mono/diheme cytochrome c family protein
MKVPGTWFAGGLLMLLLSATSCDHPSIRRPSDDGLQSALRGRYLANAVSLCVFCHSEIDWSREGFPPKGERFAGGSPPFPEGRPARTAPNLTPDVETGAGTWTDTTLARAVRQGIGHDGRPLSPLMPCASFREMADEDVESIILYLRSMPGVQRRTPTSSLSALPLRRAPGPVETGAMETPALSTGLEAGSYLLRIAACGYCHTPLGADGKPVPGMDLAGGNTFKGPWGEVVAPNITPDPTGLDLLSERDFERAVRKGDRHGSRLNAVMPWGYYRDMTESDVHSIYAALKGRRGVRHEVDSAELPTPCRKCGRTHGGGSRNG